MGLGDTPQLEYHMQRAVTRDTALGASGPMTNRTKGRFDRIRGADAAPMFRREIEEGHERVPIPGQALDRIRELGVVGRGERVERPLRPSPGSRLPDVVQRPFGVRLGTLREFVRHVPGLVHPATLMACPGPQFRHGIPESHGAVADGQLRHVHAAGIQLHQHFTPTPARFPQSRVHRQQLFPATIIDADDHQDAEFAGFPAKPTVDAIGPDMDPGAIRKRRLSPRRVLLGPSMLQARHRRRRQTAGFGAEQRFQRLAHVPGGDALQIQPRQRRLQRPGLADVGGNQRRAEGHGIPDRGTNLGNPNRYRSNPRLQHTCRLMAIANHAGPISRGATLGVMFKKFLDLRLDRLSQQTLSAFP